MKKEQVAALIDHTLLSPAAGIRDIVRLCGEARQYGFASVCVNPYFVPIAANELAGGRVKVCTVVGFPLGATTAEDKASEAARPVPNRAAEVDMVLNVGAVKDCRFSDVELDIYGVVRSVQEAAAEFVGMERKIVVKVILETCLLEDAEIRTCCLCAVRAGADFVKTSTGFAAPKDGAGNPLPNGASARHVGLMRRTVGADFGVKASGGIRSAEAAAEMLAAGANRIGTSSGIQIVDGWDESVPVPGFD
ncbi:MAG: deoxyribose-phosphate aldolase [Treponemataceae bacterium]|nr:deoxyribose-phosphate aldolase [Treponemataceae bacterium]